MNLWTITLIGFVLTTLATVWLFYKATRNKKVLFITIIWALITGILGFLGFYKDFEAFPPRFVFLIGPAILLVLWAAIAQKTRAFIESLDLKTLTILHLVRVPVEMVLFAVYLEGLIPDLMTFDGYNFDIFAGLSSPVIYYLVFIKKRIGYKGLLIWNLICLGLLLNILTIAVLSAVTPFQQLAFEQPNVGVAEFPFVWLPAVIVPIVLFSHLATIRQLLIKKPNK